MAAAPARPRPAGREERHRQLVELSPDAILVHDGHRIRFGNTAALALAGATRQAQLVGQPVDRFLAPPFLKSAAVWLTDPDTPATLTPPVRDTFRRLDGSAVAVEVRTVAFLDGGRPAVHLVLRDITARLAAERGMRLMEARLHQAERLEAIGTLAGGVAHEVNNMMGVVLGFSDALLRTEGLPTAAMADLREVVTAASRAAQVARQLLAFSRRSAHQPRTLELGRLLREAEPVVRQMLGPGHGLVVEAGPGSPASVDRGQLQELILNLALNARDAMPRGGTLTMTAQDRIVPVDLAAADGRMIPAGRYATLSVRDTGTGIPTPIQAHIFEPFFTTKPPGAGTGLGLAATLGILKQHEGFITVASSPGAGATFTCFLPLAPGDPAAEPPAEPTGVDLVTRAAETTVLVVDDEPAVLAITARGLERSGYRVRLAASGGEALAQAGRVGPPDLLLTDLTMPGIGGVELARRFREQWPALPILFMSGYPAEELLRQGGVAAAHDCLEKPFSVEELAGRVAGALARAGGTPVPSPS